MNEEEFQRLKKRLCASLKGMFPMKQVYCQEIRERALEKKDTEKTETNKCSQSGS